MALQIDDNTDFNYLVPLAPTDGNLIAVNHESGLANLLFYQARKQTGEHIDKVDVTGAILMNIDALKQFRDAISDTLDQVENREP